MSSISYDPDAVPDLPIEFLKGADRMRMKVVQVICDEPGAKVGDATGVSFFLAVHFVPRIGDRIGLQDGKTCQVIRVFHRIVPMDNVAPGMLGAVTIIIAHLLEKPPPEEDA